MTNQARFGAPAVLTGPRSSMIRLGFYTTQFVLDLVAVVVAVLIAYAWRFGLPLRLDPGVALLPPLFGSLAFLMRCYSFKAMLSLGNAVSRMARALALTLALFVIGAFAMKQGAELSRGALFASAAIAFVLLVAVRVPVSITARRLGNRFFARLLILDGAPAPAAGQFEVIDAQAVGLRPDVADPHMLDLFSGLAARYDRVIVSCLPERREDWSIYLKGSGCWGELLIPELHGLAYTGGAAGDPIGVVVAVGPFDLRSRILKRGFDLAFAIPALIVLSPVFVLIALAIKLDSPGPVFFRQRRMGRSNRLFRVLKFRSMHVAASDADGTRSATRDDDRISRVGRIIRASSVDELPQLLNVIAGDMSLVGPRPHALGSLAGDRLFWQVDTRYWLRHAIKPGITGLAQVRGHRGATEEVHDLEIRLRSDLEYVGNWSLIGDLVILVRTLLVVFHKNAY